MKLRKAIKLARKNKCRIKNERFKIPMVCQDAKSLVVWLISDTESNGEARRLLTKWLKSDAWELDFDEF
jgi:hypothetical protein